MELTEKQGFVARLSVIAITQLPFRFVKKPKLTRPEIRKYDEIYEELKQDGDYINLVFEEATVIRLLSAVQLCLDEENESLRKIGKSVSFQNYLSNKYGSITKDDFIELIELINKII
jgi:hypothetical protein